MRDSIRETEEDWLHHETELLSLATIEIALLVAASGVGSKMQIFTRSTGVTDHSIEPEFIPLNVATKVCCQPDESTSG